MPRTDLTLSEVGFGVWTVATNWRGRIEDAERAALLEKAVELGVNFFDTADTYDDDASIKSSLDLAVVAGWAMLTSRVIPDLASFRA